VAQVAVVIELRRLLPLDDLLAVTREFLDPDVSRSAWIAACGGIA
jgi:hypothetical protein